jgi:hypothetical protein
MSAAVVICKSHYPYYLAHELGERLLGDTKRVSRGLAQLATSRSSVDYQVVLGNQLDQHRPEGQRRPTLAPYWVAERTDIPSAWGLPIGALLEHRRRLARVPSRRISQARSLFDRVRTLPAEEADAAWVAGVGSLLRRMERDRGTHSGPMRAALRELGGLEPSWYEVNRQIVDQSWRGHALADVLVGWDWLFDLEYPPDAYEGGER